jgi:hypothetical protein
MGYDLHIVRGADYHGGAAIGFPEVFSNIQSFPSSWFEH